MVGYRNPIRVDALGCLVGGLLTCLLICLYVVCLLACGRVEVEVRVEAEVEVDGIVQAPLVRGVSSTKETQISIRITPRSTV